METTEDYVKIQRKLVELVQGIISESKELSYEMSPTHIANTPVRDYVTGLIDAIGFKDRDLSFDIRGSWIGDVVQFSFAGELNYTVLKSEVVRAQTYAKLINLGNGLMEIPDHLYTDSGVVAYLNDLSVLMELSPKAIFTDEELDASIEAYTWWGENTPLVEHIQRAATAYLPGNGFQREAMLTRAFLAYAMLVKMEKDNVEKHNLSNDATMRVSEGNLCGND